MNIDQYGYGFGGTFIRYSTAGVGKVLARRVETSLANGQQHVHQACQELSTEDFRATCIHHSHNWHCWHNWHNWHGNSHNWHTWHGNWHNWHGNWHNWHTWHNFLEFKDVHFC
jgi:hypothetical protein